jgi:ESCRT-II complex subunit VPS25
LVVAAVVVVGAEGQQQQHKRPPSQQRAQGLGTRPAACIDMASAAPAAAPAAAVHRIEDFPPFYTLQPVEATRERQLTLWRSVVLRDALASKQATCTIDVTTFASFRNDAVQRSLDLAGRQCVGDSLVAHGNAEWEDVSKTRLRVSQRTLEAWAALIYEWARESGRIGGSPSTVYEIHSGEDVESTELANLHPEVCMKALQVLERQGKCVIVLGDSVDTSGVKFV